MLDRLVSRLKTKSCGPLVGAWATDEETVVQLGRLLSPPSRLTLPAGPIEPNPESTLFKSSEFSGKPASRRKISTDSLKLFFFRNCKTASRVCCSSVIPVEVLVIPVEVPVPGDVGSGFASLALLFPHTSLDGSVFMSFSSSVSTRLPCTAAILEMNCACAKERRGMPTVQDPRSWLALTDVNVILIPSLSPAKQKCL